MRLSSLARGSYASDGFALLLAWLLIFAPAAASPAEHAPRSGWLILSGNGEDIAPPDALARFRALAGGAGAEIVFVPTAASSLRLPSGRILEIPEDGAPLGADAPAFAEELAHLFGVRRVTLLHTRDRSRADDPRFLAPLRRVQAVWLSSGNAGRLAEAYLDTGMQRALEDLLARGGVIGGNSAGAIIQGSTILRGRPDKPVLLVEGHDRGFAFLTDTVINPHVVAVHREDELISVVDWRPNLLGIGIDTGSAVIVHEGRMQPLGAGRVAIYDNVRRDGRWYYWLEPNACFDLTQRRALTGSCD